MTRLHICLLAVLAIGAYTNLLFVYIIISILQSLAGFQIPELLRPATSFIYDICEPFLRLFRSLLPTVRLGGMGLDLSPILAFLVLNYIATPIVQWIACGDL